MCLYVLFCYSDLKLGHRRNQDSHVTTGESCVLFQNHVELSKLFSMREKYLILVKLTSVLYILDFHLSYNF